MPLVLTPNQEASLADVAERWGVETFELFGSALDDRFGPDSDVDLLVSFQPGVRVSLFDLARMEIDLEAILERPVDLVMRVDIEQSHNPIRRSAILSSARPLYRDAA